MLGVNYLGAPYLGQAFVQFTYGAGSYSFTGTANAQIIGVVSNGGAIGSGGLGTIYLGEPYAGPVLSLIHI